jgi:Cd2+/Zn2+-exporting ATPase
MGGSLGQACGLENQNHANETHSHHTEHEHEHHESRSNDQHAHSHDHGHSNEKFIFSRELGIILIAFILFLAGLFVEDSWTSGWFLIGLYGFFISSYLIAGWDVLENVFRNIRHLQIFDENFLMFIATIGAFATQNLGEAVAVMMFYKVGQTLEDYSVNKSRKSIQALLNLRPESATVKIDGNLIQRHPTEVKVGDIIVVKPGEKVALDGTIMNDGSLFDTSALTGESVPRRIQRNEVVLAGMINMSSLVEINVSRPFAQSSIAKILDLVENAETTKSRTVKFISRFAKYYTPIVVLAAVLMATLIPLLIPGATYSEWIYRAMIFLVISCPCALIISIPLSYFAGIGAASRKGILIKGAHHLDTLAKLDTVVFDKTGTITKGVFKVSDIVAIPGTTQQTILQLVAQAEINSTHPIAKSILQAYGQHVDIKNVTSFMEIPAHGVVAAVNGQEVIAGSDKILHKFKIPHRDDFCVIDGTVVHVAVDKNYIGYILISDETRENSAGSLKELREMGINELVMLSGDDHCIVESLAQDLGFTKFRAELLPENKVDELQELRKEGSYVGFIGDGINDAPVIAGADVGIAMGGMGSDAAIETADIVLMTDDIAKVPLSIRIARKTRTIIWQNIIMIFAVKILFLLLGAFGMMTMWGAVFADVGLSVLAVANAMRALVIGQTPKS